MKKLYTIFCLLLSTSSLLAQLGGPQYVCPGSTTNHTFGGYPSIQVVGGYINGTTPIFGPPNVIVANTFHIKWYDNFTGGSMTINGTTYPMYEYRVTSSGSISGFSTVHCDELPPLITNSNSPNFQGYNAKFQWQKSTTSSSSGFVNITGATGSTYQPPMGSTTTWYRRLAYGCDINSAYATKSVKVTVIDDLEQGIYKESVTQYGLPYWKLHGPVSGGDGNYNYTWRYREWRCGTGNFLCPTWSQHWSTEDAIYIRKDQVFYQAQYHRAVSSCGLYDDGMGSIVTIYVSNGRLSIESESVPATESSVAIYPNPVTDFLQVKNVQSAAIYSISGAHLGIIDSEKFNMCQFEAGVYLIRGKGEDGSPFEQKVIKR